MLRILQIIWYSVVLQLLHSFISQPKPKTALQFSFHIQLDWFPPSLSFSVFLSFKATDFWSISWFWHTKNYLLPSRLHLLCMTAISHLHIHRVYNLHTYIEGTHTTQPFQEVVTTNYIYTLHSIKMKSFFPSLKWTLYVYLGQTIICKTF